MNRLFCAALIAASALPAMPAQASVIVIWPVDPTLKPGEQATALWLENKGDEPVTLQVRSFDWAQPQGDDTLTQQDEVVVSPPIATVAAGKRQLVRIIRRNPGAPTLPEKAYRLLIDEVPTQPAPGGPTEASARLAVQMRYSIPLFIYAADPATQKAALVSRTIVTDKGREIEITNTGVRHARLTDLRVVNAGQERMIKAGLNGYVLAGATVRIALPGDAAGVVRMGVNGADQTLVPGA